MIAHTDSSPEEDRRRVLIAIGVATGLLSLVAAASAYGTPDATLVALLLVLGGGCAFGFAALLSLGVGDWLTDDDQLLWSTGDGE